MKIAPPRLVLSALVTLAAGAVLVADSAEPRCGTYKGVEATFAYATNCMGTDASGTVTLSATDATDTTTFDRRLALGDVLSEQMRTAGLNVRETAVTYDTSACDDSADSVAQITGMAVSVVNALVGAKPGVPGAWFCPELSLPITEEQTVTCIPDTSATGGDAPARAGDADAGTCSLTVRP